MLDKRQVLSVFIFCVVCVGTSIISTQVKLDDNRYGKPNARYSKANSEGLFKEALFYRLNMGKKEFSLIAKELTQDSRTKQIYLIHPTGEVYGEQAGDLYYYKGERGYYDERKQYLKLMDNVVLYNETDELKGKVVEYKQNGEKLYAEGEVFTKTYDQETSDKIRIESDFLKSAIGLERAHYWGHVRGEIVRKRDYEEGIKFTSNRLYSDLKASHIELIGDVTIQKGYTFASSHKGDIYLQNYNKKLKYFTLSDDVKLKEKVILKSGEQITRKAFAEKLDGIMSDRLYVLTGYPKVHQREDIIKGNKILLRENNETVEVDDSNSNFIIR